MKLSKLFASALVLAASAISVMGQAGPIIRNPFTTNNAPVSGVYITDNTITTNKVNAAFRALLGGGGTSGAVTNNEARPINLSSNLYVQGASNYFAGNVTVAGESNYWENVTAGNLTLPNSWNAGGGTNLNAASARNLPFVNILRFGAVMGGDLTEPLQTTINYCATSGIASVAYIPDGSWSLTNTLYLSNGVSVLGGNVGQSGNATGQTLIYSYVTNGVSIVVGSNSRIEGLFLRTPGVYYTNAIGVLYTNWAQNTTMRHCMITGFGVNVGLADTVMCSFYDCLFGALTGVRAETISINAIKFTRCDFVQATTAFEYLHAGHNISFDSCIFYSNDVDGRFSGYNTNRLADVHFNDCDFEGSGTGISLMGTNMTGLRIQGCTFQQYETNGVFETCDGSTVANNTFYSAPMFYTTNFVGVVGPNRVNDETGLESMVFEATGGRFSGNFSSSTGSGLELKSTPTATYIDSYDRDTSGWMINWIRCNEFIVSLSASLTALDISGDTALFDVHVSGNGTRDLRSFANAYVGALVVTNNGAFGGTVTSSNGASIFDGVQVRGTSVPAVGQGLLLQGGATPYIRAYNSETNGFLPIALEVNQFSLRITTNDFYVLDSGGHHLYNPVTLDDTLGAPAGVFSNNVSAASVTASGVIGGNALVVTNAVQPWAGPTNSLPLGNTIAPAYYYTLTNNASLTNFTGIISAGPWCASLLLTNGTSSNVTFSVSAAASRFIGGMTNSVITVPAGLICEVAVRSQTNGFTCTRVIAGISNN